MDNEGILQLWGLKDLYYHEAFEDGSRCTVCLLTDSSGFLVARGLSLCSPLDQFIKRNGRARALGRAVKAYVGKQSSLPINHNGEIHEAMWVFYPGFKSAYLPTPNPYEEAILSRANKVPV